MTRRGMTILELLLALVLLSGLTIACVSWTTGSARALHQQGGDARWRAGAENALQLIDDALRTEPLPGDRRERWRIATTPDALQIRTRAVAGAGTGEVTACGMMRIRLHDEKLQLVYLDTDERPIAARPLLGATKSILSDTTPTEDNDYELTVRLRSTRGGVLERSWRITREQLR